MELLIRNVVHKPRDGEDPQPGSGSVEALDRVVAIQRIEE